MNFFGGRLNNTLALMEVCSSLWYLYWRRENLDTTWFIWQGDATLTQMGSRGSWLKLTAAPSDLILFLVQNCIECNNDIQINGNVSCLLLNVICLNDVGPLPDILAVNDSWPCSPRLDELCPFTLFLPWTSDRGKVAFMSLYFIPS